MSLEVDSLDEPGARIQVLMDLQPPQGLVAKVKALGKLRELASFSPRMVKSAPCQEVWMDAPDLTKLPILTCWPDDGGPYITLPLVFSKDPTTGVRNCGMYRVQVIDERTAMMHWQIHKDGAAHLRDSDGRVEVAIAIGTDPAVTYSATAPLPPNIDEMLFAGFLRGDNVDMVPCRTVDVEVPANAEFVIEGYVDATDIRPEGPFGDHTGFYTPVDDYPTLHITAISHRRDPIYATTIVGPPPMEDYFLGKATERMFLPLIRMTVPDLYDMNLPAGGRVPQLRDRLGQEALPGAREEAHERRLGSRAALADALRDRRRPRRRRPQHLPGRLHGVQQRRPRPRPPDGRRTGRRPRPRGARTSPTGPRSASTPRASGPARARCGRGRTRS